MSDWDILVTVASRSKGRRIWDHGFEFRSGNGCRPMPTWLCFMLYCPVEVEILRFVYPMPNHLYPVFQWIH